MSAIDREKLLAWLNDECSREQHVGKSHVLMRVMAKVRSGAFDIKPPEVQWGEQKTQKRLGAIPHRQTGEGGGRNP